MAKLVSLKSGRAFESVTAAKEYFTQLLDRQELRKAFDGEDLADIRAVYVDYCGKTDWAVKSPPSSFYPTHGRGPGYTTRCYGVTFDDGTTDNFSMEKALRVIATEAKV